MADVEDGCRAISLFSALAFERKCAEPSIEACFGSAVPATASIGTDDTVWSSGARHADKVFVAIVRRSKSLAK